MNNYKLKLLGVALFALMQTAILLPNVAVAADFSVHGYYRNRIISNSNIDMQQNNKALPYSNNRFGFISYNQMRLRLEPTLKLGDNISIQSQFDVLDNVLFGTNDTKQIGIVAPMLGEQTLPAGAGSFSMTGPSSVGENGAINIRRVWADILTPIGKFRIGRQPSHWGLGIFQNDGNGRQGDFGDSADRIAYLVQYDIEDGGAVTGGLVWDIAAEAQVDPRIDGLLTAPSANNRDCQQYGALFLYEHPNFTLGGFGGLRRRNGPNEASTMKVRWAGESSDTAASHWAGRDGDTLLYFADLYAKYVYEEYKFQFEGIYLGGKVTTGLALNELSFTGVTPGSSVISVPPDQTMRVLMFAFEAEAKYKFGSEWKVQAGFAPGDGTPLSQKITQLGFRPDYQVALMMFNMPLGSSPGLRDNTSAALLAGNTPITGNYINNALYVSAGYKHRFDNIADWAEWFKVGGKVTTAWAHTKNTQVALGDILNQEGHWPSVIDNASSMFKRWYGIEADVSAEAKLFDYLYTAFDAGVLVPGKAYDVDVALIDPGSIVKTIPFDKSEMAWMVRLTTAIEF